MRSSNAKMRRGSGTWPDNFREETSARGQFVQPCRGQPEEKPELKSASSAGAMQTPSMSALPEHPSFVRLLSPSCFFFVFFWCIHHLALTLKQECVLHPPAVYFMQHDWLAILKSLNKSSYITCPTVLPSHWYCSALYNSSWPTGFVTFYHVFFLSH